jgi:hypothetical protein
MKRHAATLVAGAAVALCVVSVGESDATKRVVATGPLIAVGADGRLIGTFPRIPVRPVALPLSTSNNSVGAIVADGHGGWYVGGGFLLIGGVRCPLAHILADGVLDRSWCAWLALRGRVGSLVRRGNLLFVAGAFTRIANSWRLGLAIIDLRSREVTAWAPRCSESKLCDFRGVASISVHGSTVYLAGPFNIKVDGSSRFSLAAVDVHTGKVLAWDPKPDTDIHGESAFAVLATGGVVYVAGGFSHVGGAKRPGFATLDPVTGAAMALMPHVPSGCCWWPFVSRGVLYLSKPPTAYSVSTGKRLPWKPALKPSGAALASLAQVVGITNGVVYVSQVTGGSQSTEYLWGVRGYSASDGSLQQQWQTPALTWGPWTVGVSSKEMVIGGNFYGIYP